MFGRPPQPTTTFPFGSSCALPMNGTSSPFGWAYERASLATASAPVERDHEHARPRPNRRRRAVVEDADQAALVVVAGVVLPGEPRPGPIWKSERLPPKRQSTLPVSLCTL